MRSFERYLKIFRKSELAEKLMDSAYGSDESANSDVELIAPTTGKEKGKLGLEECEFDDENSIIKCPCCKKTLHKKVCDYEQGDSMSKQMNLKTIIDLEVESKLYSEIHTLIECFHDAIFQKLSFGGGVPAQNITKNVSLFANFTCQDSKVIYIKKSIVF